jgi:ferredoxin
MNDSKLYDFLLIGSGPNSAIALHELVNNKKLSKAQISLCMVTMSDNKILPDMERLRSVMNEVHWDFWDKKVVKQFISNGLAVSKIKNKPYFGNQDVYDSNKSETRINYEEGSPRISRYFGGFTNVWGGVLEKQPASILSGWPDDLLLELDSYYNQVIDIISNGKGLIKPNLHGPSGDKWVRNNVSNPNEFLSYFTDSYLAINENSGCNKCGLCQIGCPYDQIWSAKFLIDSIYEKFNFDLELGVVDRIKKEKNYYKISILKEGKLKHLRTKKILLGAGPIGTAAILQRSEMISDKILVRDTQTVLNTYIDIKQIWRRLDHHRVTLTDATLRFLPDFDFQNFTSLQLYFNFNGAGYKLQNSTRFLRYFPLSFLTAASRILVFTISYFDTSLSGTISIQYNSKTNLCEVSSSKKLDKNEIKKTNRIISKKLRSFGLIRIPFSLFLNMGGGYHFGASLPMLKEKELESDNKSEKLKFTNNFGELTTNPGVYIIDASNFPFIPTGSIALLSMANALRISRHISNKFAGVNQPS